MSQELNSMAVNGVLPVSVRDRASFTPARYLKDGTAPEGAPVYLLAPLRDLDRSMIFRALYESCGAFVTTVEIREMLKEGITAVCEADEATPMLAELDELAALDDLTDEAHIEESRARQEELQTHVIRLQTRLSREYPPLAKLIALNLRQKEELGTITVRAVVRDWKHLPGPCKRRNGLVTLESMVAVPDEDLDELYPRCRAYREVSTDLEPGSASP